MRLSLTAIVTLVFLPVFVACDSGDGRDLQDPSVPYVAPTDPTTTTAP